MDGTLKEGSTAYDTSNRCLAHACCLMIKRMITSDKFEVSSTTIKTSQSCTVYLKTKQTKKPADGKLAHGLQIVTVHGNICGPLQTPSFEGMRYFLILTAVLHRCVSVNPLQSHAEVEEHYFNFVKWIDKDYANSMKRFRSDDGAAFLPLKRIF